MKALEATGSSEPDRIFKCVLSCSLPAYRSLFSDDSGVSSLIGQTHKSRGQTSGNDGNSCLIFLLFFCCFISLVQFSFKLAQM